MIRFGITERGDVAFDNGWIEPLRTGQIAAAVLISKGLPSATGKNAMIAMKDRIIFHATTTGYGHSIVEPNVTPYKKRLHMLASFCYGDGFPLDHVVIRVDPIFPTVKGIELAENVCAFAARLGFRRFRYSWLDTYSHVIKRFHASGIDLLKRLGDVAMQQRARSEWVDRFTLSMEQDKQCVFESCAENNRHFCGCISRKDFALCGLDPFEVHGKSGQRVACGCCGNKKELLARKSRCPHQCLYCYWVD